MNVGYKVAYNKMEERGLVSSMLENKQFSPIGIVHKLSGGGGNYIGGNGNRENLVV